MLQRTLGEELTMSPKACTASEAKFLRYRAIRGGVSRSNARFRRAERRIQECEGKLAHLSKVSGCVSATQSCVFVL